MPGKEADEMENRELLQMDAVELAAAIREGRATVRQSVEAVLEQIEKRESDCHCYVTLDPEGALRRAEEVQREIEEGRLRHPLAGVPMAVKDNLCTAGLRTTCSSRMLAEFVPSYSAEAVKRLEQAGAVLIGKTNLDEFAMGSTTETSYFGVTRNPHDPARVPGGSSGGSAAAVAAGECFFALGTDTGGSIRQPASHCGVVGMKPTYGTVSRYGLIAYASSMDQVGPLAKSVADCAVILETLAGRDEKDATSLERQDTDFSGGLNKGVKGLRIGIPRNFFSQDLSGTVAAAVREAAGLLGENGAVVEEFTLPLTEYAVPAYYTIASAEAGSNLERFDGVKYGLRAGAEEGLQEMYRKTRSAGFGEEVKRRIMLGSFVLSSGYYDAYYLKALRVRTRIRQALSEAFAVYDCLLGPVAPTTAPGLGESLTDPLKMYAGDLYTVFANLAGLPAISVPCGTDADGLPVGLQLTGDCFQEKKLLRIAYTYEQLRKEADTAES